MSKRKFFSLAEKVKITNYAEKNPHLSSRKLAEEFGCGRTCIQTLIKQDEAILTDLISATKIIFLRKKGDLKNFKMLSVVWFCMAREALIPVSGPMIQEEALHTCSKTKHFTT